MSLLLNNRIVTVEGGHLKTVMILFY